MALKGKTFQDQNVDSLDDAILYSHLSSNRVGVLLGIQNDVDYSFVLNTVNLQSGYINIYGRVIEVEETAFIIPLAPIGTTLKGYVIVKIDLSQPSGSQLILEDKEGTDIALPSLIQGDLRNGDLVYEFPILDYDKSDVAITASNDQRDFTKGVADISVIDLSGTFVMPTAGYSDVGTVRESGNILVSGLTLDSLNKYDVDIAEVDSTDLDKAKALAAAGIIKFIRVDDNNIKVRLIDETKLIASINMTVVKVSNKGGF